MWIHDLTVTRSSSFYFPSLISATHILEALPPNTGLCRLLGDLFCKSHNLTFLWINTRDSHRLNYPSSHLIHHYFYSKVLIIVTLYIIIHNSGNSQHCSIRPYCSVLSHETNCQYQHVSHYSSAPKRGARSQRHAITRTTSCHCGPYPQITNPQH